jgi:hypothetical protein
MDYVEGFGASDTSAFAALLNVRSWLNHFSKNTPPNASQVMHALPSLKNSHVSISGDAMLPQRCLIRPQSAFNLFATS